jgi:hypothetical protein
VIPKRPNKAINGMSLQLRLGGRCKATITPNAAEAKRNLSKVNSPGENAKSANVITAKAEAHMTTIALIAIEVLRPIFVFCIFFVFPV